MPNDASIDEESDASSSVDAFTFETALDVANDVPCVHLDGGTFVCGDASCNSNVEWCAEVFGGPYPTSYRFSCEALPTTCNGACDDVNYNTLGCTCDDDGGRVFVACPVP